jgi:hypothetical protein
MENARNYIFVNYMRATEIETKGTSCPQYFTYCCIFSLYIYGSAARNVTETKFIWKNGKLKRPYKRSFLIQMALVITIWHYYKTKAILLKGSNFC